ncbi:MAG: hypothetical protein V7459_09055 [Oceanicoccus sp.]
MKLLQYISSILLTFTLAACANQSPQPGSVNDEGLTTYSHNSFEELAIRQTTDFGLYKRIKIDPVTVAYSDKKRSDMLNRGDEAFQFDDKELEKFNRQFVKGLSVAWGKQFGWEVTDESASDVILVKAAIVDLYLYGSIKNNEILPSTTITEESSKMVIELTLVDSQNGSVLLESRGKKITGWRGQMTRTSSVTYWNDAYRAFLQWASLIGNQIDHLSE